MNEVKISASKMAVAEECQYHFWLRYVKRLRPETWTHPAAAVGSVFHAAIENWYKMASVSGSLLTVDSLKSQVQGAWAHCVSTRKFRLAKSYVDANKGKMIADTSALLEAFFVDEANRRTLALPAWQEKQFSIPWDTGKGFAVIMNGFIDRMMVLGGEAFITDYKTSSILPDQTKVDEDIQLTFYSAAYRWLAKQSVTEALPPAERFVELYYPKFRRYMQSVRTKDHFDDLKSRLIKVGEIELNELKNATPSENACRFCEFAASGDCKLTPFRKVPAQVS